MKCPNNFQKLLCSLFLLLFACSAPLKAQFLPPSPELVNLDHSEGYIYVWMSDTMAKPIAPDTTVTHSAALNEVFEHFRVLRYEKLPAGLLTEGDNLWQVLFDSFDTETFIAALDTLGLFSAYEVSGFITLSAPPCTSPVYPNDWVYNGDTALYLKRINAPCAWEITKGDPNMVIGVVDNHLDHHADLEGKIVYHFDYPDRPNDFHGTVVAGFAVASTNNGFGLPSIGYNTKMAFYQLNTVPAPPMSDSAFANYTKVSFFAALEDTTIKVYNCSWWSNYWSNSEINKVKAATQKGKVIFFAAGNYLLGSQTLAQMAQPPKLVNIPGVVCVGTITANNQWPMFAGKQYVAYPEIDLIVPGYGWTLRDKNLYVNVVDPFTSHASPVAAGTAALMLSVNPCLTGVEIENMLKATAAPITWQGSNAGHPTENGVVAGHLDAYEAVKMAKYGAIHITNTQTWTHDTAMNMNIVVDSAASLTVTGKITFCTGKGIVVKAGGRLVVDGGHLTSLTQWKGIQVLGKPYLPQLPYSNQGYVALKNGATIENAETGVLIGNIYYSEGPLGPQPPPEPVEPWWYGIYEGGGVLKAASSSPFPSTPTAVFKNNREAVKFMPYELGYNLSSEYQIKVNLSSIRDCDFIVDKPVAGGFKSFIDLYRVGGIKIHGCSFENALPDSVAGGLSRGTGIRAMDSKFFVGGMCFDATMVIEEVSCGTTLRPSTFKGLHQGVHVMNGTFQRNFAVGSTAFENCNQGVRSEAVDFPFILRNSFALNAGFGVQIVKGHGYMIQENFFSNPSPGVSLTYGINIQNGGPDDNLVYRNTTAASMDYSFTAVGKNVNPTRDNGLQLLCNTVSDSSTYGIYAAPGAGPPAAEGIKQLQGTFFEPAGNVFARNGWAPDDNGDYSSHALVSYFYDTSKVKEHPLYTSAVVRTVPAFFQSSCPSKIFRDMGNIGTRGLPDIDMVGFILPKQKHDSIMTLTDGGSTPTAVQTVNNFSDPGQLFDYLQNMAPWNSKEVLYAASERGLLDQHHLLEAMLANPDATRDFDFLEYLEHEAPERLLPHEIDSIRSSWHIVTERTELEHSYAAAMAKATYAYNTYLAYYMADTVQDWTDSIRWLLRDAPLLTYKYHLVEDLLAHGLNDSAWMEIDSIPHKFGLHPYYQDEHDYFVQLSQLQQDLASSERDIFGLDSAEMDLLWYLADRSDWIAGQRARNILQYVLDTLFELPPIEPPTGGGGFFVEGPANVGQLPEKVAPVSLLRLFPNPASGTLNIHYAGETTTGLYRFQVFSLDGRLVKEQQLKPAKLQSISVEGITPGLYVVSLQMGEHFLREKLVVKQ